LSHCIEGLIAKQQFLNRPVIEAGKGLATGSFDFGLPDKNAATIIFVVEVPHATGAINQSPERETFDLDQLLHPARAFEHPSAVVDDPDLTLNEKRAILASWASDACAVEASPDLRPAAGFRVSYEDVIDALKRLDGEAARGADYGQALDRTGRLKCLVWRQSRCSSARPRSCADEAATIQYQSRGPAEYFWLISPAMPSG
jgi:hypothetical protein